MQEKETTLRPGELVLFKNNQVIALNKPSGIPVQDDKSGASSLLAMAQAYCQKTLYLVHRIDRPASGVVLFAKTPKALKGINEQFQNRSVEKTYLAITAKNSIPPSGELRNFLKKNQKLNKSFLSAGTATGAKEALLQYDTLLTSDNYHLLQILLRTGRHHQIRAQLAGIGCPIKGDVKYGSRRSNRDRSINLHAWKLAFRHPISSERIEITAPFPAGDIWPIFEKLSTA